MDEEERVTTKQQIQEGMRKNPDENNKRVLSVLERSIDDDGTEIFSFSSEQPVEKWFGDEILVHDQDSMDVSRVGHSAVLLFAHGRDRNNGVMPIGKIERVWLSKDERVLRVRVTPDREDEQSARVWKKWDSDQLRGVSFGYAIDWDSAVYLPEETQTEDGRFHGPALVCYKWEVFEISIEPVPADPTVGKGRSREELVNELLHGEPEPEENKNQKGGTENAMDEKEKAMLEQKEAEVRAAAEKAVAEERARVAEINAICSRSGIEDEERDKFIQESVTVEDVRKAALDKLTQDQPPVETAQITADETDKFRAAAIDALRYKGLKAEHRPKKEDLSEGAKDLMFISPRELARECLMRKGFNRFGDIRDMVGRALVSTDLPRILGDVASKSLTAGWDSRTERWRECFDTIPVPDFKPQNWLKFSEFDDLEQVKEYQEYPFATIPTESAESFKVATFGKMFSISRQAIINDDLNAITRIPANMGESAQRKVGDLPWSALTSNGVMGDGINLFAAEHGNLLSAASPTSVNAFNAAVLAMKSQKDLKGLRRLNIVPEYVFAPISLEGAMEQFFVTDKEADSVTITESTTLSGGLRNTYYNKYTRIYEPRLDDASETNWYMAGPKGKTIIVGFLDGIEEPYFEEKQSWSRDGVEYKVRIDACAFAADWKALLKNPYAG